jgi:hypothetical protein
LKTVGLKNWLFRSLRIDFCLFDPLIDRDAMLGKLCKLVKPNSQKTLNLLF